MMDNADLLASVRALEAQMAALDERITRLEALSTVRYGTWVVTTGVPADDQPEIVHDVAPNAPR